jgi:hypothetical protein
MATEAASGIVASYAAAWAAHDGLYWDPTALVEGREALLAHIGGFHERMPGARVGPATGVDAHGGDLRFGDGRLKRIVGFFAPFPPG